MRRGKILSVHIMSMNMGVYVPKKSASTVKRPIHIPPKAAAAGIYLKEKKNRKETKRRRRKKNKVK